MYAKSAPPPPEPKDGKGKRGGKRRPSVRGLITAVDAEAKTITVMNRRKGGETAPVTVQVADTTKVFLGRNPAENGLADPRAARARVLIEKPGAPRFARTAGVEICRERADDD